MARVIEGELVDAGGRFAIVAGRFNDFITTRLVDGCEDSLRRHGVDTDDRLDLVWVPGAFELPMTAKRLAATGRFDVVICLGAIIRSATPHFDFVAAETARGIASVGLHSGVPVPFGVITTDDVEQAIERAGTLSGNRGWDAAANAIEMANLLSDMT